MARRSSLMVATFDSAVALNGLIGNVVNSSVSWTGTGPCPAPPPCCKPRQCRALCPITCMANKGLSRRLFRSRAGNYWRDRVGGRQICLGFGPWGLTGIVGFCCPFTYVIFSQESSWWTPKILYSARRPRHPVLPCRPLAAALTVAACCRGRRRGHLLDLLGKSLRRLCECRRRLARARRAAGIADLKLTSPTANCSSVKNINAVAGGAGRCGQAADQRREGQCVQQQRCAAQSALFAALRWVFQSAQHCLWCPKLCSLGNRRPTPRLGRPTAFDLPANGVGLSDQVVLQPPRRF